MAKRLLISVDTYRGYYGEGEGHYCSMIKDSLENIANNEEAIDAFRKYIRDENKVIQYDAEKVDEDDIYFCNIENKIELREPICIVDSLEDICTHLKKKLSGQSR